MMKLPILSLFVFLMIPTIFFGQDKRPQLPEAPFPYNSEVVSFQNEFDSVRLAGTLTYPKKGTNFPAVVLISGSGPQDRNSELFGHQPFHVIADYLTKKGIAVLRVDDRGTGESEGTYNETNLAGFIRDTEYAVAYLKTRKEINSKKIGLVGHSLGGVIAPMIASKPNSDVDFVVLLAGTSLRGDRLMLLQKELIERKMGLPDAAIVAGQKNIGGAYDIILKSNWTSDSLISQLKTYFNSVFGEAIPAVQIEAMSRGFAVPWLIDFIKYNPVENLEKVKCSVLALNGSNDLQVPAKENLSLIKTTIEQNGNPDVTVIELPKLNHLFQTSETGLPDEYQTIEETFSPKALKIIAKWIQKRV